ncbi:MAG: hypothetical protein NTAFB09_15680 [Nitrosospira sp.]
MIIRRNEVRSLGNDAEEHLNSPGAPLEESPQGGGWSGKDARTAGKVGAATIRHAV